MNIEREMRAKLTELQGQRDDIDAEIRTLSAMLDAPRLKAELEATRAALEAARRPAEGMTRALASVGGGT